MNLFGKYLIAVSTLLFLVFAGIKLDIYYRNKLPDLAVDFDEKEMRTIQKFTRQVDALDDSNRWDGNKNAISFGKKLFFDKKLSKSQETSCATCHDPSQHWVSEQDHLEFDVPSLWNVKDRRWLFWDGRSDSLWSQAMGPLENPHEQASSRSEIVAYVAQESDYIIRYEELFGAMPDFTNERDYPRPAKPDPNDKIAYENWQKISEENQQQLNLAFANIAKMLGAFEKTIVTSASSFDVFLEGLVEKDQDKVNSLSASAQRGLKIFIGKGQCALCHNGTNLTDEEFHFIHLPLEEGQTELKPARLAGVQKLFDDPFNSMGKFSDAPEGKRAERLRFLKEDSESIGHYKTPSLRNVEFTAPYMHNKSFKSLRAVIDFYSEMEGANKSQPHLEKVVQPLHLSEAEKNDLEAFLKSLSSLKNEDLARWTHEL